MNNENIQSSMMSDVNKMKLDRSGSKKMTGYASIDRPYEADANFFQKHPVIPNLSIYNAVLAMSLPYRKEDALNCYDLTVTYDELIKDAKTLSKGLKELGVKKGDIVTCLMPNFYQAVVTFFAANRIGAVISFLNSSAEAEEVKYYLNLFESKVFVNYDKSREYNEEIKKDTSVEYVVTLDSKDLNKYGFEEETDKIIGNSDFISYRDMKLVGDYYKQWINTLYGKKNDALILFTSGTTGLPKSVLLTNENFIASGTYLKNSANIPVTHGEKCLVSVPFCYPYGFATSTLMSFLCGRQVILAPNVSADNINYFLKKKPNIIFGSPALLELVRRNTKDDTDLSSVHTFISGGDFLTPKNAESGIEFFKKHGSNVTMCNGSGNAETSANSTTTYGLPIKPETVGKPLVGTDAIILDKDTGEELKYGETGILCVRGKHIFKGYYKRPNLTDKVWIEHDGKVYFNTETLGHLDEDGYFTLTGRQSRFYIRSDLNKVYCDKVQNIIGTVDGIENCAVVKMPDEKKLYVGKAYVVLKEGMPRDEVTDEYIRKCLESPRVINDNGDTIQLKPFEIPETFEFVDALPRTKADKIDYLTLEKMAEEEAKANEKAKKGTQKVIKNNLG